MKISSKKKCNSDKTKEKSESSSRIIYLKPITNKF